MNYAPFAVYVIGPLAGFPSKVGIAVDIKKRLESLQCSNWERLYVHEVFWVASKSSALKVEKLCKRRLKEFNIRGEWFNVFSDDMVKELEEIVDSLKKNNEIELGALKRKENYAGMVEYEYDILD